MGLKPGFVKKAKKPRGAVLCPRGLSLPDAPL